MRLARTLDRQRVRCLPCAILGRRRVIGAAGGTETTGGDLPPPPTFQE